MRLVTLAVVLVLLGGCAVRICDGRLTRVNPSSAAPHGSTASGKHTP